MGYDMKHAAAGPRRHLARALFALGLGAALSMSAMAQERSIVMASTTSTEQSGLFGHLLPEFKKASGIDIKVVALGTGQALDTGRRGDADIVFVHDQVAEEKFVAEGFGLKRLPVMYNDFVLIGPAADPAKVRGKDITAAYKLTKKSDRQQALADAKAKLKPLFADQDSATQQKAQGVGGVRHPMQRC